MTATGHALETRARNAHTPYTRSQRRLRVQHYMLSRAFLMDPQARTRISPRRSKRKRKHQHRALARARWENMPTGIKPSSTRLHTFYRGCPLVRAVLRFAPPATAARTVHRHAAAAGFAPHAPVITSRIPPSPPFALRYTTPHTAPHTHCTPHYARTHTITHTPHPTFMPHTHTRGLRALAPRGALLVVYTAFPRTCAACAARTRAGVSLRFLTAHLLSARLLPYHRAHHAAPASSTFLHAIAKTRLPDTARYSTWRHALMVGCTGTSLPNA